jgi:DNA-binding NtrC family response regulator
MNKNKTVLIVDDDESILRMFTRILNKNGYITDNAKLAKEATAKMQNNRYDVALIDLRLPDADGTDLLTKIPETDDHVVKIVISGLPATEIQGDLEKNGADTYLQKPINPEKLLKVIAEELDKKKHGKARHD